MKKLIIIIGILSCFAGYGQISTREKPVSWQRDIPILRVTEKTHKQLPPLDTNKIKQEDREREEKGMPPRYGYKHKVNFDLENSGEWTVFLFSDLAQNLYMFGKFHTFLHFSTLFHTEQNYANLSNILIYSILNKNIKFGTLFAISYNK